MSVALEPDPRLGQSPVASTELAAWDRSCFFHPSTHLAQFGRGELPTRIMTRGNGCTIQDRDGQEYLDAFAGLYCVNVGYGRDEIADAIAQQAQELAYYHAYVGHGTEASIRLAHMVLERAPKHMSKVYFGLTGSDANETNIKLVWYYHNILKQPRKKKVISRHRGYHGSGVMSGSLTGLPLFHVKFDLPLPLVLHTEAPYYYRRSDGRQTEKEFVLHCVAALEELIAREGADTIAAFIGEPVLGTGGLVPPPAGYWEAIMPILRKHSILLIADEVVTAFGRLGSMFASESYAMEPDLITIAKGLTSAYAPLSGSIVSAKMWKVLEQGTDEYGAFGHGWTYSAHPVCAAAGIANLELVDRLKLPANALAVGSYLLKGLQGALGEHAHVGEVRGSGMLAAVELVEDRAERRFYSSTVGIAAQVASRMLARGVIARAMPHSDIIGLAPPLCLTCAEADRIVDVTAASVREVLG